MKATGIVRRIDDLGRIVVPMELRKYMGISTGDPMEIYVNDEDIILRSYHPGCVFCGKSDDCREFGGKRVCRDCRGELTKIDVLR